MCVLKLDKMEDILSVPKETKVVEIGTQEVLSFLYRNNHKKGDVNSELDIEKIRRRYIKNLQKLYNSLEYEQKNIKFDISDIRKVEI